MAPNDLKNRREKFRRRKHSFLKKAYELGKYCDADVAVIIHKNGRYFTYRSTDQGSWPPSMEKIVSQITTRTTCNMMLKSQKKNTYPLPKNLLPQDMETQEHDCKHDITEKISNGKGEANTDLVHTPQTSCSQSQGQPL